MKIGQKCCKKIFAHLMFVSRSLKTSQLKSQEMQEILRNYFLDIFYFAKKKQPLGNKNASRSFKYRMNLIPVKIYDQKKNHQTFIIEFRKQCSKRRAHETTRNTG